METWFLRILLTLTGTMLVASASVAQVNEDDQVIDPDVERREVKRADLDSENWELGLYLGLLSIEDFEVNPVVGLKGAYHISEDLFTELNIGYSKAGKTSFERLSGSPPLLSSSDRNYIYWNVNLGWNILPGEAFWGEDKVFNNALYIIGGLGSTYFTGDNNFTVNYGLGYRLLMNDSFALRIDFRDQMFDLSIAGEDKLTHNFEGTVGLTWFF